jgi:hypothetical protein
MFDADGYKISKISDPKPINQQSADYVSADELAPELKNTFNPTHLAAERNFDDTNLLGLKPHPYETRYGQFSFLPRVMIDSMKVKLGSYFYASDILDHISVLGGVAANHRLDLDIFAMMEYRKLPPTLFIEFYYFTRNVKRRIEVIPDYPSKTPIDVHFRIIEGDIGGYYDVLENLRMRASFVHSRYTNKISNFYYEPQRIVFGSPPLTYFIGNHFRLQWDLDKVGGGLNRSINPTAGRKVMFRYSYEFNKFFVDYFTSDDNISSSKKVYANYDINKLELDWAEYIGMPWSKKHALTAQFKGGYIDRKIDSFFNFFAGGLPGLRGYPYYAIEGRKMMLGRFTYRFPIFSNWQKQFLHITTNKLYLSTFFEIGNAFDEDKVDIDQFKRVVGGGLRLQLFSFYGFPTAFAFDVAYGLDNVSVKYENEAYEYGKELRYYFTLLFDFID